VGTFGCGCGTSQLSTAAAAADVLAAGRIAECSLMELGLRDRGVVVTGGASNIGRAIVHAFAAEGARVLIADIDQARAARTASETPGSVEVTVADVTSWESTQAMAATALERLGAVDVLVNCAGWTIDRLFIEKPREEWEKEVAIDLWGFINCTRAVLDHMIERRQGRIVSIGSDAGRVGEWREAVYSGTKAGVIAMSKAIAKEVGRYGITLNVVCPGFVPGSRETSGEDSMWSGDQGTLFTPEVLEKVARSYPLRRLGTPEDIAPAVLFLASDRASYITGQTLSVSGGYTML
jgi:2-hydroxycyclohexanecarboxyl-CoA dehydrogenase